MSQAAFEGKFKRADAIFSKPYFFEHLITHLILCISFKYVFVSFMCKNVRKSVE